MILVDKRELKILPRAIEAKFFLIAMVLLSVFFTSCDESSVVGLDVQPTNDLLDVTVVDTATLITKTVKMDSLRTDETIMQLFTNNVLLGTYIDPVFGKSTAALYTQINLNTSNPGFGVNPVIDSVVLALVIDTAFYGKRQISAQQMSVYQLSEDLKIDSSYHSGNSLSTVGSDLSNYTFIPNFTKWDTILGEALKPQLRIPLDANFGQTILNNQNTTNLADNTAFQNFMKGLYITTENTTSLNIGEGNIFSFNVKDSQSRLTLYYHNDTAASLKYDFSTSAAARFSKFTHDIASDIDLGRQLSNGPPAQNDVVFVQSMSGTKVKIEMPYIMNWSNNQGATGINKAELVIKINTDANYELSTFAAPEKLMLYGINDDGTDFVLPDIYETRPNYFGGVYNSTTQEYRFNISRYIQQLLMGERNNNGLHLLAFNGAIHANRLVIGGGGSGSAYQMKLNITSTKAP